MEVRISKRARTRIKIASNYWPTADDTPYSLLFTQLPSTTFPFFVWYATPTNNVIAGYRRSMGRVKATQGKIVPLPF
jgi:hypothetical protein